MVGCFPAYLLYIAQCQTPHDSDMSLQHSCDMNHIPTPIMHLKHWMYTIKQDSNRIWVEIIKHRLTPYRGVNTNHRLTPKHNLTPLPRITPYQRITQTQVYCLSRSRKWRICVYSKSLIDIFNWYILKLDRIGNIYFFSFKQSTSHSCFSHGPANLLQE